VKPLRRTQEVSTVRWICTDTEFWDRHREYCTEHNVLSMAHTPPRNNYYEYGVLYAVWCMDGLYW
jgi:hypothetical protein